MAYYVSVVDGPKVALALGPFNEHGAALARVDDVKEFCLGRWPSRAGWWSYGTVRHRVGRPAGKLNRELGFDTVADCVECGRVFDLTDEHEADEYLTGHDCTVEVAS